MTDEELDRLVAELSDDTLAALAIRNERTTREEVGTPQEASRSLGLWLSWCRPAALLDRLVAEVQRLRAEARSRDALEAWRLVDPVSRWYRVETYPSHPSPQVSTVLLVLEGRLSRCVVSVDLNSPAEGLEHFPPNRVYAGHRCGVAAVVAAALARWRELYEARPADPLPGAMPGVGHSY